MTSQIFCTELAPNIINEGGHKEVIIRLVAENKNNVPKCSCLFKNTHLIFELRIKVYDVRSSKGSVYFELLKINIFHLLQVLI